MPARRFVIGDVHGCIKTLAALLFEKCRIAIDDKLYFVGDYIDRGPNPRAVIDLISELKGKGQPVFALRGNHEEMLLSAIDNIGFLPSWLINGAGTTLSSFDVDYPHNIDKKYLDFISELPYYYELEDFIIVHAGLNFDIPNPLDDTYSMLWLRNSEIDNSGINNKTLIVGHTPVPLDYIKQSLDTKFVKIDGGCVYHQVRQNLGYLCAFELNSKQLYSQINIENEE